MQAASRSRTGRSPNLREFLTQKHFSPRNKAGKPRSSRQLVNNGLVKPANVSETPIGHEKQASGTAHWDKCRARGCASPVSVGASAGQRGASPRTETSYIGCDTPSATSLASCHPRRSLRRSNRAEPRRDRQGAVLTLVRKPAPENVPECGHAPGGWKTAPARLGLGPFPAADLPNHGTGPGAAPAHHPAPGAARGGANTPPGEVGPGTWPSRRAAGRGGLGPPTLPTFGARSENAENTGNR